MRRLAITALPTALLAARLAALPPVRPLPPPDVLGPPPLAAAIARQASQEATTLAEAVDLCVQADMAAQRTPGAAVAVLLDGQFVYQRGYGVKHRRNGGAVNATTRFRIGSITKQMTAAAVLQQVEAGTVSLAGRVTSYVPEFSVAPPFHAEEITVEHLLTHTSGFPDNFEDINGPRDDAALADWAGRQEDVRLFAPPGSFWNYTNPGYMLAGLVAERAAGTPYHRLMPERVWGPAGMTATTLLPETVIASGDWSYGHSRDPATGAETIVRPDGYDNWWAAPAGYAFSTAPDLARWALLLMDGGGAVLRSWAADAMQRQQVSLGYTPDLAYGYGVMAERYKGLELRHHGGNISGYGAMLMWVPASRFAVAVLANTTTSLTAAAYCTVDAVLHPPDLPPPDYRTDPSTWGPFTGTYEVYDVDGSRFRAEVTLEGSGLWLTVSDLGPPQPTYRTRMVSLYARTFMFDSDADGEVDLDLTFLPESSAQRSQWMRNRYAVGTRLGTVRRRLSSDRGLP